MLWLTVGPRLGEPLVWVSDDVLDGAVRVCMAEQGRKGPGPYHPLDEHVPGDLRTSH